MVVVEHRLADVLPLIDRVVVIEAGGGVVADGTPDAVFADEGARLKELGVWVPGAPPSAPARRTPPGGEAIVARHLSYLYPRGEAPALEGVTTAVRRGSALAITGPNGSGKSTLAMLLAGLLRPQRGDVRAFGEDPSRLSPRALVRRIGTVFQDPEHQLVAARVDDELRVGPRAVGLPTDEIERRVRELLERLDLAKLAAANPFTLSGGEKRRLSVGTALATAPGALVLDEPTFGQDRRTFTELLALLSGDVASGVAIGLRLVGIALAGIVAVASIDPTDLSDALVEHLHAPRRFTVGALAAFRLMPLFADEWQTIAMARRARGLDNARVTAFFSMTRSLLVAAIRRATRLAVAMDGRGFADTGCRTLARPRAFRAADWTLFIAAIGVALLATV